MLEINIFVNYKLVESVSGLIVRFDIRNPVGKRIVSLHKGEPDKKDDW